MMKEDSVNAQVKDKLGQLSSFNVLLATLPTHVYQWPSQNRWSFKLATATTAVSQAGHEDAERGQGLV